MNSNVYKPVLECIAFTLSESHLKICSSPLDIMVTPNFLEMMAFYNKWQNEKLFKICDGLNADQLYLERKMFFDSIFKTLNHILYVDKTIYTVIHTKTLPKIDLTINPCSEL